MFVNETKADLDFYMKSYNRMQGNKSKKMLLILAAVFLGLGVLVLLLELFVFSREGDGIDYTFSLIFFIMAVALTVLTFSLNAIARHSLKQSINGRDIVYRFTFDDEGYTAESTMSDGTTGTTKSAYINLTEIKEYDDMWLVSISKTNFPILKSGMVEGTADELSAFLKEKIGIRYVVANK